jgi:hypothetical protein
MHIPHVNYLAVLVAAVAIFILGGLWYSPVLFLKQWLALIGKTDAELKSGAAKTNMTVMYIQAFVCGLVTAYALAVILRHFEPLSLVKGMLVAVICWAGFTAVTSYGSALFEGRPRALWVINAGYNLVSFVIAAAILSVWR